MIFWEQLKIQNGATEDNSATISYPTANNVVTFNRPVSMPTLIISSVTLPSATTFAGPVTLLNGSSFAGSVTLPNGSGIADVLTKESDEYKLNVSTATATNASITGTATIADANITGIATITNANITGTATITNATITNLTVTNPVDLPENSSIGGTRIGAPQPKNSLYISGHFGDYEDYIRIANNSLRDILVLVTLCTDSTYHNTYINSRDGKPVVGSTTIGKGRTVSALNFWDADGDPAKAAYVHIQWKYPEDSEWQELDTNSPFTGNDVNAGLYRTFGGDMTEDWCRFVVGAVNTEFWFIYSCPFDTADERRASFLNMLTAMENNGYNYVLFNNAWQTISEVASQARVGTSIGGGLIAFRPSLV